MISRTASAMPCAVVAENILCRAAADRFAHGAFGDLPHHVVGIGDVEQIGLGIGDLIGDGELHVDDVLVAGQHQARNCRGRGCRRRCRPAFRRCWRFRRSRSATNGNAGRARTARLRLAEAQLDGHFVGLHGVDRLEYPERQHGERDQPEEGRAGAAATRQRALQPVLAAADDVFEIGRGALRAARAARALPPRPPLLPPPPPMGRRHRRSDCSRA